MLASTLVLVTGSDTTVLTLGRALVRDSTAELELTDAVISDSVLEGAPNGALGIAKLPGANMMMGEPPEVMSGPPFAAAPLDEAELLAEPGTLEPLAALEPLVALVAFEVVEATVPLGGVAGRFAPAVGTCVAGGSKAKSVTVEARCAWTASVDTTPAGPTWTVSTERSSSCSHFNGG